MKVVGFSFIRNAATFQYPIVEAIRSILPLCDEVVVAVGRSTDNTRELVAAISPKVRIIDTEWDDTLKEGGRVLAVETDKAYAAIPADADWCIYIQGDEVLHEDGYDNLRAAMTRWLDNKRVDGLLLRYRHFFGSYNYVGAEGHWYRHEIRVLRKRPDFYSYKDAQGFRKGNNQKLRVKPVDAYVHHYGWVQDPKVMKAKFNVKDIINHGAEGTIDNVSDVDNVVVPEGYAFSLVNSLARFEGRHPAVMQERIAKMDWKFEWDMSRNWLRKKDKFKNFMEKWTGWRPFTYKNYKVI
ncbi:glycosyltransferase family 2 protein [Flaviaesturariibacter flavus]|uniref:Glycosyltransferase family 2 protein n=1 Tax=Flaviaesturariibacter flavus TaxID=2502780 RepID=A0A4R1B548_9BACT|nr:glycosyltransferase family 2 protein [Flaviaesturariibacter flavus]TCJ13091.1 glycosyltransferase family 2 protein [Flaviaesturariibacter flavus]TCJ17011.1 glycosyltransferase family 2 protein [Flaviaesturariibacter flavus]